MLGPAWQCASSLWRSRTAAWTICSSSTASLRGVIEAKPEGTTLTEVEHQSGKYVAGLPAWIKPPVYPLPFIYESTGAETRFTNGYDPDARSRRVFTFHRPETLAEWYRSSTTRARSRW